MESPSQTAAKSSPSSAAEQARIRRERRQAKLKAEGGSRLNRITSTQSNSRLYETAASQGDKSGPGISAPSATPAPVELSGSTTSSGASAQVHDDPPDVVLSEHYYQPTPKPRQQAPQQRQTGQDVSTTFSPGYGGLDGALTGPSEEEMRQMLAQYGAGGAAGQLPGMGGVNDPVMAIMQQMMGIPIGAQGEAGANIPQPLQQQQTGKDKWGVWWKVLHTLGALLLAFWSLKVSGLGSEFDGTLKQRDAEPYVNPNFFYYFATMELVLQSSRFVIEKGRPPPGSMLGLIGQVLPPSIGNYFITVARYSVIWTTVVSDAFLIIFVLGIMAWWNSRASLGA